MHPLFGGLLTRLWSDSASRFWTLVGTVAGLAGTIFTCQQLQDQYRVKREQEARISVALEGEVVARLRWAAADGVISSAERRAFERWVDGHAKDQERIAAYRETLEPSLVEAARSGIAGAKLIQEGKLRPAVVELQRALRHDSDNLDARINLGGALLDLGDPAGAEKELREALAEIGSGCAIDPEPAQPGVASCRAEFLARYNLAGSLAGRRPARIAEAVHQLDQALGILASEPMPGLTPEAIRNDLKTSRHFVALAADEGFQRLLSLPMWASDSGGSR